MFYNIFSYLKESQDLAFWASALFGSILFFLRACASFFVHSHNDSVDHFDDCGSNMDDSYDPHNTNENIDSKTSFKLFSIHSISGFFMMLGWVGLACSKQLEYSPLISAAIAFLAGLTTMVITGLIFRGALLLINPGCQFDIRKTIGHTGIVYQCIPENGFGKIQLEIDGMNREILAQSLNNCTIKSFTHVKVVKIFDNETVIVEKTNS